MPNYCTHISFHHNFHVFIALHRKGLYSLCYDQTGCFIKWPQPFYFLRTVSSRISSVLTPASISAQIFILPFINALVTFYASYLLELFLTLFTRQFDNAFSHYLPRRTPCIFLTLTNHSICESFSILGGIEDTQSRLTSSFFTFKSP